MPPVEGSVEPDLLTTVVVMEPASLSTCAFWVAVPRSISPVAAMPLMLTSFLPASSLTEVTVNLIGSMVL